MPKNLCKVKKTNGFEFEMRASGGNGKRLFVNEADIKPNVIERDDLIEVFYANGTKELYIVTNPGYKSDFGPIKAHYQIEVKLYNQSDKLKEIQAINNNGNGNIILNVASPNSNITINQDLSVFDSMKDSINKTSDLENKDEIINKINELKNSIDNKNNFKQKLDEFLIMTANISTTIQPFIPALTSFLIK